MSPTETLEAVKANIEQREATQRIFEAVNMPPPPQQPRVAFLVAPNGQHLPLPEPLFRVLVQAAAVLVRGEEVLVSPLNRMLSTQEAADLLNVSRPFLVRLLDQDKIPFERVGRHRRVRFGDLMRFKAQRAHDRRKKLETLVRESEELGLYDLPSSREMIGDGEEA